MATEEMNITGASAAVQEWDKYDKLARLVRENLNITAIYRIMAEKILPGK